MESEDDIRYKTLFPEGSRIPLGLPIGIRKLYTEALKLKPISSNAFGVQLGRVLEEVCADRSAKGKGL